MVAVLSLTETVSYGVLMYAFSVVLAPMEADLGWSQAALTGAFSLAALVAGVCAIPIGRWVDRYGPRLIMTGGSIGATGLLLAWSRVEHLATYYLIWIGLGACMAAVFYEPAFAVVATWFREHRGRALTIITLAGGLASTIFVPLTSWLVLEVGWSAAIRWLAAILGILTIAPHALFLRRRPSDLGLTVDGARSRDTEPTDSLSSEHSVPARVAVRTSGFRWLSAAFSLSTLANFAVSVHLVPLLIERGYSLPSASAAMAILGLSKLPGRLLVAPLAHRWSTPRATAFVFLLQAVGLAFLLGIPGATGVWLFVALFGAGDGASTPARAAVVADFFGPREYGQISGTLSLFVAIARSVAPVGISLLLVALGSYDNVLWILFALVGAAAGAVMSANRRLEG